MNEDSEISIDSIGSLIENGILSIAIDNIDYKLVLEYLRGKPVSSKRNAAFSWISSNNTSDSDIVRFVIENRAYMDTYVVWNTLREKPIDRLYEMLGEFLYSYNITKISTDHIKYRIKYLRLDNLPLTVDNVKYLSEVIDDIYKDLTSQASLIVTDFISEWLLPMYKSLNKIAIDHRVLLIITKYVDYDNLYSRIKSYGSLFRVSDKSDIYIAYLLGYDIRSMIELNISSRQSLLDQLMDVEHQRNIVIRRCNSMAIRSVASLCSLSISTSSVLQTKYDSNILNSKDSIGLDNINLFSPFDVVRYRNFSGKIAQITRKEYKYILKESKNPWTNEIVPKDVIKELEERESLAIKYSLPECQPVNILLWAVWPEIR